jgi:hypothetical protein
MLIQELIELSLGHNELVIMLVMIIFWIRGGQDRRRGRWFMMQRSRRRIDKRGGLQG